MTRRLTLVPLPLDEANELVARWHRHSNPTVGHKFSLGAAIGGEVVGAAIVGRPVARHLDDGWTLEVLRCVTAGERNACSFLFISQRRRCCSGCLSTRGRLGNRDRPRKAVENS